MILLLLLPRIRRQRSLVLRLSVKRNFYLCLRNFSDCLCFYFYHFHPSQRFALAGFLLLLPLFILLFVFFLILSYLFFFLLLLFHFCCHSLLLYLLLQFCLQSHLPFFFYSFFYFCIKCSAYLINDVLFMYISNA